jgi:hypothetical protein
LPRKNVPGIDKWGFPIRGPLPEPIARRPLRGPGSLSDAKVIEGLRKLCAGKKREYTLEQIAEACGCGKENIRNIETRGKRKMRAILSRDPAFLSLMRQLGQSESGRMFESLISQI